MSIILPFATSFSKSVVRVACIHTYVLCVQPPPWTLPSFQARQAGARCLSLPAHAASWQGGCQPEHLGVERGQMPAPGRLPSVCSRRKRCVLMRSDKDGADLKGAVVNVSFC